MSQCLNGQNRRLPEYMIDIMLQDIRYRIANPSGIWADYNCLCNQLREWNKLVQQGMICSTDLPDYPNVEDYPDLDSECTVKDCPLPQ